MAKTVGWRKRHPELAHLPELESTSDLTLFINTQHVAAGKAAPGDGENCALALGCKAQLQSPLVCIQKAYAYVAGPGPWVGKGKSRKQIGETVDTHPDTKWVVYRYMLGPDAEQIVIENDTGKTTMQSALITLKKTEGTGNTKEKGRSANQRYTERQKAGVKVNASKAQGARRAKQTKELNRLKGIRDYQGTGG